MFQTTNQCSFDTWMSWRKPLKMTNTPGKSIPQSWIWKISQIISNSRNWWLVHRFRGFYMPYYITIVEPSGTIWISQYYMLVFEERTMDRVIFSFFFLMCWDLLTRRGAKCPGVKWCRLIADRCRWLWESRQGMLRSERQFLLETSKINLPATWAIKNTHPI